jgi:TP901 family phage tail tape measure protein
MADQFQRVGLIAAIEGIESYTRDVRRIAEGQDKVQAEMRDTAATSEKTAEAVVRDWNKVGRNMVLIGGAITAALAFGAKSAIDFESAMGDVRKTVDEGEPGFMRLEAGINDMARRLPLAREEIARTLAAAGQLGIEGVDNLLRFTEVAIGLGIATDLSAEQASFALAQLFNVTGEGEDRIGNIGAVIVDLGNNTATTESRILNFAQRIAASATNAEISTENILALSATVLSLGVNTERGASQISNGFIAIAKAIAEGGDELQQFAKISGLASQDFVKLWRKDALAAFELFIQGVGTQGRDAIDFLISVGLEGIRAVEVFQALGRAQGDLSENIARANAASAENIALAEEVARRNATTASQIRIAWNEIKIAFGEAGTTLLPILRIAIDTLKIFLDLWTAIPAPLRAAAIGFALVAGSLLGIGGSLLILTRQTGLFTASQIQAAAATRVFGTSLQLLIPVVGLALAAITALTFGVLAFTKSQDDAAGRAAASGRISEIADTYDDLGKSIKLVVEEGGEYLKLLTSQKARERAAAAGTARMVELTTAQFRAIGRLVDQGIAFETATEILISQLDLEAAALDDTSAGADAAAQAQADLTAAAERGAAQTSLTAENIEILSEKYLQAANATDALAADTTTLTPELDKARDAAIAAAQAIGEMGSRALATKIILDRLTRSGMDVTFDLLGAEAMGALWMAADAAMLDLLVDQLKLEDQLETGTEALLEQARAMAGLAAEANGLGGAAERIALGFDRAVASIQAARAQFALGFLIDELRAAGGNEEALALALLLASEARTGQEITTGIRTIADLFPEITSAIRPPTTTGGDDVDRGIALLLSLLGGAIGGGLPSFQTGGLVTGGARFAPILAQLHVGEFVIPADKVQALLGPRGPEASGRGDVHFTANYFELESPVRVRDDLEALRMAGRF